MINTRTLVFPAAFFFSLFSSTAYADTIRDAIQLWTQELRNAEAATPTEHPATYNSQTGVFFLSVFEAVNASTGAQWNTLSGTVLGTDASPELAAAYAAHAALSASYSGSTEAFDTLLAKLTAERTAEENAAARGVGIAAYDAVSSSRSDERQTFFLSNAKQFMPGPPPPITGNKYAFDYNQVKVLGGMDSTERTDEQSATATFWSDNRTGTMVALHYNAEQIISGQGMDGVEFARGMAQFAGGMHDALLSVSASKGAYETARPVEAIHNGNADGNPRTEGDPTWVMFGNNVPPEDLSFSYASGGGTLGSYFANMIGHIIGTDRVTFEYRYLDKSGSRQFERLSDMQLEFGWSRIYNGEHFMHDVEAGWFMSEKIAGFVHATALLSAEE